MIYTLLKAIDELSNKKFETAQKTEEALVKLFTDRVGVPDELFAKQEFQDIINKIYNVGHYDIIDVMGFTGALVKEFPASEFAAIILGNKEMFNTKYFNKEVPDTSAGDTPVERLPPADLNIEPLKSIVNDLIEDGKGIKLAGLDYKKILIEQVSDRPETKRVLEQRARDEKVRELKAKNGKLTFAQEMQYRAGVMPTDEEPEVKETGPFSETGEYGTNERNADGTIRPEYYGGKDNPYEPFKVIRAWDLNFYTGNVVKYVARAGKKNKDTYIQDLEKALTYLQDEISAAKKAKEDKV